MTIHLLKCFGAAPGGGNPALVVEHDAGTETERQQFAFASQVSACVFIDRQPDGAIVLDYFIRTRAARCACTPPWPQRMYCWRRRARRQAVRYGRPCAGNR